MVPAHFVALERMPLTPNAKIDRKALPAPDAAQAAQAEYVAPSGELEGVVAALWQDVLGIEKVGTRDNFFDIGGHSLLVVRLHRSLAEVVDRPLSLTDLYRFPTIESLVSYLESDGRSDSTQKGSDRAKLRKSMRRRRARS
jgi:acyl carrier protein